MANCSSLLLGLTHIEVDLVGIGADGSRDVRVERVRSHLLRPDRSDHHQLITKISDTEDVDVRMVMDRYGIHTKTEAVDLALRHLAGQPMSRDEAPAMRGAHTLADLPADPGLLRDSARHLGLGRVRPGRGKQRRSQTHRAHHRRRSDRRDRTGGDGGSSWRTSDARERDLRRLLQRFQLHPIDPAPDFEAAAWIYRQCPQNGITPRGLMDCLIAAVAWRTDVTLLAYDIDLHRVAGVVGIDIDPASQR